MELLEAARAARVRGGEVDDAALLQPPPLRGRVEAPPGGDGGVELRAGDPERAPERVAIGPPQGRPAAGAPGRALQVAPERLREPGEAERPVGGGDHAATASPSASGRR